MDYGKEMKRNPTTQSENDTFDFGCGVFLYCWINSGDHHVLISKWGCAMEGDLNIVIV